MVAGAQAGPVIDLSRHVRPGSGIWWSQASAEPTVLVHALLDQADRLGPVRAFCGLSWDERLTTELPDSITVISYGALGALRQLSARGRLTIVPCSYSALPRLFADGSLPCDVGLVQVSPPDADGLCSLGVGVDYAADAVAHTPVLIAEVNRRMPATAGSARIPLSRFSAVVETDRPLLEAPQRPPDEAERAIGRHVAGLIEDGDTIQLGVGSLPSGLLQALTGHVDLGVHSGMISDAVLALVDQGVITGRRKEIDPGVIVTGAAMGSQQLYQRVPSLPVEFRAASYTHSPGVLAQLRSFVAINSALEVDLSGQIGAELRRGVYVGAAGGQADFSRAACTTGVRSVIALRSRSGGESAKANVDWHLGVAVASHNELLAGLMTALSRAIYTSTENDRFVDREVRRETARAHRSITAAIRAQDSDAAVRRMERHVYAYAKAVIEVEERTEISIPDTD